MFEAILSREIGEPSSAATFLWWVLLCALKFNLNFNGGLMGAQV